MSGAMGLGSTRLQLRLRQIVPFADRLLRLDIDTRSTNFQESPGGQEGLGLDYLHQAFPEASAGTFREERSE
jgi:hypothetical protein